MKNTSRVRPKTTYAVLACALVLLLGSASAQVGAGPANLVPDEPFVVFVAVDPAVPLLVLGGGRVPTAGGMIQIATETMVEQAASRGMTLFLQTRSRLVGIGPRIGVVRDRRAATKNPARPIFTKKTDLTGAGGSGKLGLGMADGRGPKSNDTLGNGSTQGEIAPGPVIIICPKGPGGPTLLRGETGIVDALGQGAGPTTGSSGSPGGGVSL